MTSASSIESMIFKPIWSSRALASDVSPPGPDVCFLVLENQRDLARTLGQLYPDHVIARISSDTLPQLTDTLSRYARIVLVTRTVWSTPWPDRDFATILSLFKMISKLRVTRFDLITERSVTAPLYPSSLHPVDAAYVGLGQTLSREVLGTRVRVFSLANLDAVHLNQALAIDFETPRGTSLVIKDGAVHWAELGPAQLNPVADSAFRRGGRYLIIGANGGLGGVFARHLARTYRASLILWGRRAADASLVTELEALGAAAVTSQSVDIEDAGAMADALRVHGDVDGIIHSALHLEDSTIELMSTESLSRVLAPKLRGAQNLAEALRSRSVDFVLFFSSIQSYLANGGQGNYTAACVAKDAVADVLHNLLLIDTKVVNWAYWGEVGVVAKPEYRERMRKAGVGSIGEAEGIEIVERLLRSDERQVSVIKAADTTLDKLNIRRRTATPALHPDSTSLIARVLPPFDPRAEVVRSNEAATRALRDYTSAAVHATPLPARILPKFEKLTRAIARIPRRVSPPREVVIDQFPQIRAHIALLDACLREYPRILAGQRDPLEILFPNGSLDLVTGVYANNPISDYYNAQVAEVVDRYASLDPDRRLGVLEIGSGTGSTSKFVLPKLDGRRANYIFSDLSLSFLSKGRRLFGDRDFVDYRIIDVSKPIELATPVDVVLATNVMHATADIRASVRNVANALAPNGVFILNEITEVQDFATVTFGLTEGWWLSADGLRIPDSPLLDHDRWTEVLRQSGFADVVSHGSGGQHVFVARKASALATPRPPAPASLAALVPAPVSTSEPPALDHVVSHVKDVVAKVLEMDPIEISADEPFSSYGVDSLISLEILKPFAERYGYIPTTALFEYPNVLSFATYLREIFPNVAGAVNVVPAVEANAPIEPTHERSMAAVRTDRTRAIVVAVICETLDMAAEDIRDDAPFSTYGIDSLITLEIMKGLESQFGYLPTTLLFEHPTLAQLCEYLGSNVETPSPATLAEPPIESSFADDHLAIIGMSARVPGAESYSEFWANLKDGRDCSSEIPSVRWDVGKHSRSAHVESQSGSYTRRGAFISDVARFDHEFFNVTPNEARRMDPQERLFLQEVYHALQDCGVPPGKTRGSATGVFVGVMNGGYDWLTPNPSETVRPTSLFWSIANRVSYFYDLKGPSLAVDTACSSSLTALHLAGQALRAGDCRQAIVGGVNLIVHPRQYEVLCNLHMLSKNGICRAFGAEADGFVAGEGICAVVIKRYADAVADGDRIHAVVRGTAVNSGGRANGYFAPHVPAQADVVRTALDRADVPADQVGYVEAHGTGTLLGDPVEIRGLTLAFAGAERGSISIGSVKPNVGHLESAAGLSGLIKAVLQMRHGALVPSLHADVENPHLNLNETPFRVNTSLRAWPTPGRRISCVSSFGAGGANAHVVLERPGAPASTPSAGGPFVVPLSHETRAGLQTEVDRLRRVLRDAPEHFDVGDVAYTLGAARDHHTHRVAFVVRSIEDLIEQLRVDLRDVATVPVRENQPADRAAGHDPKELAAAYVGGATVDWKALRPGGRIVTLPGYAFAPNHHWIDAEESNYEERRSLVTEHSVGGLSIAPASWTLSELAAAPRNPARPLVASSIVWAKAISDLSDVRLKIDGADFQICGIQSRTTFAHGRFEERDVVAPLTRAPASDAPVWEHVEAPDIYRQFAAAGYAYGPAFQTLQWAKITAGRVNAFIYAPTDWGYAVSPALLDGGFQTSILMPEFRDLRSRGQAIVPVGIDEFVVLPEPFGAAVYCECELVAGRAHDKTVKTNFHFTDDRGRVVARALGFTSLIVDQSQFGQAAAPKRSDVICEVL